MTVVVKEVKAYLRQMRSRMPFRFGKTVMAGMPVLHLRVKMEDGGGRRFEGWSACGLVSMWFDKDYSKPEAKREADLMYSVHEAVNGYLSAGAGTSFQLHRTVEPQVREKLKATGMNGLVAGYGIALADAAIIDGVCRHHNVPFHQALKDDLLGMGSGISALLPDHPSPAIALRHTIGLGDPLTSADVKEVLDDGLPQTLEQVIADYGASYFKIKVNNDIPASLERLAKITSVLEDTTDDYRATLDGNEAFPGMETFHEFISKCAETPNLKALWDRVLWIEQPVARQQALEEAVRIPLKVVSKYKPVIIDESDDSDDALDRALALGYAGISAKNCKGVYRTLGSYTGIKARSPDSGLVLSSEDLTNQPILPNHQDLCVAAALGIGHSERNGHHFFRSFEFLSPVEREQALRDYPSLYESTSNGIPSLRFDSGLMSLTDINNSPGLGVKSAPEWESLQQVQLPQNP